jgi:hypothetical protein
VTPGKRPRLFLARKRATREQSRAERRAFFFAKKRKDAIGEYNVASSFVASRSENERAYDTLFS